MDDRSRRTSKPPAKFEVRSLLGDPEPSGPPENAPRALDLRWIRERPGDVAIVRVELCPREPVGQLSVRVYRAPNGELEAAVPRIRVSGSWESPFKAPASLWFQIRAAALAMVEAEERRR